MVQAKERRQVRKIGNSQNELCTMTNRWLPIEDRESWPNDIPDDYFFPDDEHKPLSIKSGEKGLKASSITAYLNSLAMRIEELERKQHERGK